MSGIIDCEMHIGDEVFVHGYIDEIRNDTIIIRNVGGYFGTSRDEVFYYEEDERGYGTMNEADRKTEPTISKMEQVDKDINVRSKDEPTPWCKYCQRRWENDCVGVAQCIRDMQMIAELYKASEDEPQTDCAWMRGE